jgi:hypothetical protein
MLNVRLGERRRSCSATSGPRHDSYKYDYLFDFWKCYSSKDFID